MHATSVSVGDADGRVSKGRCVDRLAASVAPIPNDELERNWTARSSKEADRIEGTFLNALLGLRFPAFQGGLPAALFSFAERRSP